MPDLAIIGSQDVDLNTWLKGARDVVLKTRGHEVKATIGDLNGCEIIVVPRNGSNRPLPPHAIDFRSNIDALVSCRVKYVLTTSMVGTLRPIQYPNDSMYLLDQFIDFTKDRQFSYFENSEFGFADMTEPFCRDLRQFVLQAAERVGVPMLPKACYIGVPGPRFETAAEVRMYGQMGGDVIGHTTTTECIMAREAGLCFATVAGVITVGAGLSDHKMSAPLWHGLRRKHAVRFRCVVEEIAATMTLGTAPQCHCGCALAAPIERPNKATTRSG